MRLLKDENLTSEIVIQFNVILIKELANISNQKEIERYTRKDQSQEKVKIIKKLSFKIELQNHQKIHQIL